MVFKKGNIPWNKNKKCPWISERQRGKNNPMYGKIPWNKNKFKFIKKCICKVCNKTFTTTDKRPNSGQFCSKKCKDKWYSLAYRGRIRTSFTKEYKCKIPKKEWKVAYLAGLIDGEGSILLTNEKKRYKNKAPRLVIVNTDKNMINWVKENFGGNTQIKDVAFYEKVFGKKPIYVWRVNSILDCKLLCKTMLPFLITKKEKAKDMINYCNEVISLYKSRQK